jgi:NAD(P)-dependent dehydrogenase (short-subunit alcohol dehydrogenase family)
MQAAAKLVQDAHPQGIDYVINNAGILGSYSDVAQQ